jgi:hypothetical protein
MTTFADPKTKEQQRTQERQRTTRPPGWSPDGHKGPGDWLAVTIALSIVAVALIVVGMWSLVGEPVAELATLGDAYELESLGPFMAQASIALQGDAFELERLGAFAQVVAVQGDAFELERLGTLDATAQGDALELERLGTWRWQITDVSGSLGDASELERLGSFDLPAVVAPDAPGDASELERLGTSD